MDVTENMSRRSLIKLMVLTSSIAMRPVSLLADVTAGLPTASPNPGNDQSWQHPRLFYNQASLSHLRHWFASNAAARDALQRSGNELMAAEFIPQSVAMRGPGQQENFAAPGEQMTDMGLTLGLLYHLTGDKRYADKLRQAMLYYAQYTHWTAPSFFHRSPPWHSELDTSTFAFGYATGYDALYNTLSANDRKQIAEIIIRKAVLPILDDWILPGRRIQSLDSMGHNWWGVCVSGAGLCSLALLGDDPRTQGWIDAMDAGFKQWFDYPGNVLQNRVATFEPSGPSYEGIGYTNYGVDEYLHYRLAWQNTYPERKPEQIERLKHLPHFFLHTLYPTSTGSFAVNFNDSGLRADSTPNLLLLIACGLGTPEASRYLELVHSHLEGTMLSLLRQYAKPETATDVPTCCAYPKMGWATMRSSWENDATFLAVKSGYTWNHAHADAGSFILFKQGKPLIIDSGLCAYYRPEYTTYYRRSKAHNVILFNGNGQPEDDLFLGCKFPGHLHNMINGLGLKYVYADSTGPMARWFIRNYRHWLWSGDIIFIIDDVRAHTAGKMDWLLHFEGSYSREPDGGVRLTHGPAEAVVKILYPNTQLNEVTGLAMNNPDKKVPYLAFSPESHMRTCQFITAICLNPNAMPTFELLHADHYIGVRMQTADTVEEIYLDRRAIYSPTTSAMRIGDWETDAYLLHFKRARSVPKQVRRFFMSDGSYLRHKGRSYLESLSKITACWSAGATPEIFSNDGSNSIQIAADHPVQSVNWNGTPVRGSYDQTARLVTLQR